MNHYHKKRYLVILVVLLLAPLLRELFFGIISHHHQPFSSMDDILHTVSEMFVMMVFGCFLIYLDIRFTRAKYLELRATQIVAIEALASLAEYRDAETSHHLQRIRKFVKLLCFQLQKNSSYSHYIKSRINYLEDITYAAVLHDIGKIAVPDGILLKPSSLTTEEFEVIKTHTTIGSEILLAADNQFQEKIGKQSYLALARNIARGHHEKWDGNGYPDGLAGDDIPLAARIVALCDVYDAVTSDRVYKKAWTHEKAMEMIQEDTGKHFDPKIVKAFIEIAQEFKRTKAKLQ